MENLIKAEQTANLLVSDLRAAYGKTDPVAELVLFPLLEQAAKIEQTLKSLNRAIDQHTASPKYNDISRQTIL